MKLEVNISKRVAFAFLTMVFIIAGLIGVMAVWQVPNPAVWHDASNVKVHVGSSDYSLQEAVNGGLIGGSSSDSYTTTIYTNTLGAPGNNNEPLDDARIVSLCADGDGCTFSIASYTTTTDRTPVAASYMAGPSLFYILPQNNAAQRLWYKNTSFTSFFWDGNGNAAGSGILFGTPITSVSCNVLDTPYISGGPADTNISLFLHAGSTQSAGRIACMFTIRD